MSTVASAPRPLRPASLDEIDAEIYRRSLRDFIAAAWPVVQPDPYQHNWHIDAVCEHLEACTRREIRRLIINVPPRTMKSRAVSVMWPAWSWLTDPSSRWLFASYSGDLSLEHAVESRSLLESQGGREEGGTLLERLGYRGLVRLLGAEWELAGDQNVKSRFRNTAGGARQSTSVTAKVTGFGGDFIVADDPHNVMEIPSEAQRERVLRWWDQAMSSRMNDPRSGVRVIVMQRLHEKDLTGHLLAGEGDYQHLCLPMEYQPSHPFVWPEDPRTEPGELLWPERMGEEEVRQYALELGSAGYAGQYQQLPAPASGGIWKKPWWRRYAEAELPVLWDVIAASWDCAFKKRSDSDFVVGQLWGRRSANYYLLAQVRAQLSFTETKKAVAALQRWAAARGVRPHATLVEDKANGTAVIDELRSTIEGMIPIEPEGGKEARAHAVSPTIEAGNVHLPAGGTIPAPLAPGGLWEPTAVEDFIAEAAAFPRGTNDDQVDATSQALNWMAGRAVIPSEPDPNEPEVPSETADLLERRW